MTELDPDWLEELYEFLRIPSISADPAHAADVRAAGQWVCDLVERAGGECALLPTDAGHPLAVGEIRASAATETAPTVILYGHFDVQPPGDVALWDSPPFAPEIRDGWLYGRGSVDDKGNLYLLLKAAALQAASGSLPVNVRIICDGEEETGGHSVVDFLVADQRGGDACVIFDSMMPRLDIPSFEVGTRGLAYFRVDVRTGEQDLHSGLFGGAALNALHALMQALDAVTSLPDELRAGAIPPTADELKAWSALAPGDDVLAKEGARPIDSEAAENFYLRTFAAPAVDVNGVSGGEPDLVKTVLPVSAHAHVSIRLAPGQEVDEISSTFVRLLRGALPAGAEVNVQRVNASPAGRVDPEAPALELARRAFEEVLGTRPLLTRTGGTLPIVPALEAKGIATVLTGFGAPGHNAHAPNERLLARYIPNGIATARKMLIAFGELSTRGVGG